MKFRFCHQLDSTDCGVACVQMILSHYGRRYTLNTIKKYCPTSKLGITIEQVIDTLGIFGIHSIAVNPNIEEISKMPLPSILYLNRGHFVILYKVDKDRFYVADPGFGLVELSNNTLKSEWCNNSDYGVALVVAPKENFNSCAIKEDNDNNVLLNILILIKDKLRSGKYTIFNSICLLILGMILSWISPFMYQRIIDLGIGAHKLNVVFLFAFLQVSSFIGGFLSSSYSNYLLSKIGLDIGVDLLSKYLKQLAILPLSFFDSKLSTDLIQRVDDQSRIESFLTKTLVTTVFNAVNTVVFLAVLCFYSWQTALIFCVFSLVTFFTSKIFLKKRERIDYMRFSKNATNKNNIYELINGIYDIRINGAQKTMINRWKESQNSINQIILKTTLIEHCLNINSNFINKVQEVSILVTCSYFVINSNFSIGVMMTIMFLLGVLASFSTCLMSFMTEYQYTKMAYERLSEVLVKKGENDASSISMLSLRDDISFNHVYFSYPDMPKKCILSDLDIKIPLNKVSAIVGHSGSGKTTLLKLLIGFYRPSQGILSIGGIDITKLNTDDWRGLCGVVMQDGQIFSATIAENIALAEEKPDKTRIDTALEIACLSKFVNALPLKENTPIGRSGINLSGGQKQRILIARAIYKNPPFIFLDEATSSLDANTEAKIINNLQQFYKNKTVVIIAHRLSTVKQADKIMYMENGKMVESGSHQELIELRGKYYSLVKNQLNGNPEINKTL